MIRAGPAQTVDKIPFRQQSATKAQAAFIAAGERRGERASANPGFAGFAINLNRMYPAANFSISSLRRRNNCPNGIPSLGFSRGSCYCRAVRKEVDMPCFVNLPLSWVYKDEGWLDWFIASRVAPELGLDTIALGLPRPWHQRVAARLRDAGLACAVHLPFMGVEPCAVDAAERNAGRKWLRMGAGLAKLYGAAHMIGHPYYETPRDGPDQARCSPAWLKASLHAWQELPERGCAPLFLENTYESSPLPLAALVSHLSGAAAPGSVGVCFDVGHWYSFAGGNFRGDLDAWLAQLTPFRLHLHLHDNSGEADEHLGLGQGGVPLERLFAALKGADLTATMEPHDAESFRHSLTWLNKNPEAARLIGWTGCSPAKLPLPRH